MRSTVGRHPQHARPVSLNCTTYSPLPSGADTLGSSVTSWTSAMRHALVSRGKPAIVVAGSRVCSMPAAHSMMRGYARPKDPCLVMRCDHFGASGICGFGTALSTDGGAGSDDGAISPDPLDGVEVRMMGRDMRTCPRGLLLYIDMSVSLLRFPSLFCTP